MQHLEFRASTTRARLLVVRVLMVVALLVPIGCEESTQSGAAGGSGASGGTSDSGGEIGSGGGTEGGEPDASIDAPSETEDALMDAPAQDVPDADADTCRVPGGNCVCGKPGQRCCSEASGVGICSEPGTVCGLPSGATFSTCVDCGGAGQPCCATNACANGGCCVVQVIGGIHKATCTGAGDVCPVSSGGTCGSSVGTPASCGACGALGQPCCEVAGSSTLYVCTAPNTSCNESSPSGTCQACGGPGQPCCPLQSFGAGTGECNRGHYCTRTSSPSVCQPIPVACDEMSCAAGTHCNAWTGRCDPDGSPVPPPGVDNGEPCSNDTMCRSSDGIGKGLVPMCLSEAGRWKGGYCVSYCNAPVGGFWSSEVLARSNCPMGSVCLPSAYIPSGEPFGACVRECRSDDDCRVAEGYYCRRAFGFVGAGPAFSNGYCAPVHCQSRGCAGIQCGC